jgi:hypothetical protein
MTSTLTTVLSAAQDVLERAKACATVAPRLLERFSKKVRLAEKAQKAEAAGAPPPSSSGATPAGLRAILARAESAASKRTPSPDQLRAIEEIRSRLASLDVGAKAPDLAKLADSLRSDTERLEAELARSAPPKPAKRRTPKKVPPKRNRRSTKPSARPRA